MEETEGSLYCGVCGVDDGENAPVLLGQMILCMSCPLAVHRNCIPPEHKNASTTLHAGNGQWVCTNCASCEAMPGSEPLHFVHACCDRDIEVPGMLRVPYLNTDLWQHELCRCVKKDLDIDISDPDSRCDICNGNFAQYVTVCAHDGCEKMLHPSCAWIDGCTIQRMVPLGKTDLKSGAFVIYCGEHTKDRKQLQDGRTIREMPKTNSNVDGAEPVEGERILAADLDADVFQSADAASSSGTKLQSAESRPKEKSKKPAGEGTPDKSEKKRQVEQSSSPRSGNEQPSGAIDLTISEKAAAVPGGEDDVVVKKKKTEKREKRDKHSGKMTEDDHGDVWNILSKEKALEASGESREEGETSKLGTTTTAAAAKPSSSLPRTSTSTQAAPPAKPKHLIDIKNLAAPQTSTAAATATAPATATTAAPSRAATSSGDSGDNKRFKVNHSRLRQIVVGGTPELKVGVTLDFAYGPDDASNYLIANVWKHELLLESVLSTDDMLTLENEGATSLLVGLKGKNTCVIAVHGNLDSDRLALELMTGAPQLFALISSKSSKASKWVYSTRNPGARYEAIMLVNNRLLHSQSQGGHNQLDGLLQALRGCCTTRGGLTSDLAVSAPFLLVAIEMGGGFLLPQSSALSEKRPLSGSSSVTSSGPAKDRVHDPVQAQGQNDAMEIDGGGAVAASEIVQTSQKTKEQPAAAATTTAAAAVAVAVAAATTTASDKCAYSKGTQRLVVALLQEPEYASGISAEEFEAVFKVFYDQHELPRVYSAEGAPLKIAIALCTVPGVKKRFEQREEGMVPVLFLE